MVKSIVLKIKKFVFLTKWSWNAGAEFAKRHGRVPNNQEMDELSKLGDHAWERVVREINGSKC